MSIYNCPHCGEKTFNPWTKARAGHMISKGKPCPKCGRLCVNGKGATIFRFIFYIIAFVGVIVTFLNGLNSAWMYYHEVRIVGGLILLMIIVPNIANAFFFKLSPAIRLDAKK